jgi:hypothetical protein
MIAKKPKEIEIDGEKYTIGLHKASDGYDLIEVLSLLLLPSLVAMTGDLNGNRLKDLDNPDKVKEYIQNSNFSEAGALFIQSLRGTSTTTILKELIKVVSYQGHPFSDGEYFESHFAGRYLTGYKLAWEVVLHNNFFGELGEENPFWKMKNLLTKLNPSNDPKESTGPAQGS